MRRCNSPARSPCIAAVPARAVRRSRSAEPGTLPPGRERNQARQRQPGRRALQPARAATSSRPPSPPRSAARTAAPTRPGSDLASGLRRSFGRWGIASRIRRISRAASRISRWECASSARHAPPWRCSCWPPHRWPPPARVSRRLRGSRRRGRAGQAHARAGVDRVGRRRHARLLLRQPAQRRPRPARRRPAGAQARRHRRGQLRGDVRPRRRDQVRRRQRELLRVPGPAGQRAHAAPSRRGHRQPRQQPRLRLWRARLARHPRCARARARWRRPARPARSGSSQRNGTRVAFARLLHLRAGRTR